MTNTYTFHTYEPFNKSLIKEQVQPPSLDDLERQIHSQIPSILGKPLDSEFTISDMLTKEPLHDLERDMSTDASVLDQKTFISISELRVEDQN
ncbi:hypothetical protein P9112_002824 [Eukaryota sp. TZLM1-RC]